MLEFAYLYLTVTAYAGLLLIIGVKPRPKRWAWLAWIGMSLAWPVLYVFIMWCIIRNTRAAVKERP